VIKLGKDAVEIRAVMTALVEEEPLAESLRDHPLAGSFKDRRECHLEPDWLLVYELAGDEIVFERTGTHADLFEQARHPTASPRTNNALARRRQPLVPDQLGQEHVDHPQVHDCPRNAQTALRRFRAPSRSWVEVRERQARRGAFGASGVTPSGSTSPGRL